MKILLKLFYRACLVTIIFSIIYFLFNRDIALISLAGIAVVVALAKLVAVKNKKL